MILLAIFIISSCHNAREKDNTPEVIHVKTGKVEKRKVSIPIRSSGMLASDEEIKLSFKSGGIIENIPVNDGHKVGKGELLASLDLSEIEARLKQAEQALEKARRDYQRVQNLYRDSVATLENLQNAETALEVARSDFRIAEFNYRHSKIHAPSKGIILRRLAEENEMVAAGQPIFIFASGEGNWIIRTGITDKDIVKLSTGDSARIHFDPYPGQSFLAFVSEIGEMADPYTGTYEVELSMEPTDKKLVNGFIGRIMIFPSVQNEFLMIPVDALREANGQQGYAYVLREDGSHQKKKLILGEIIDDKIIVKSGISEDQQVITEGSVYLDEDSKIQLIRE